MLIQDLALEEEAFIQPFQVSEDGHAWIYTDQECFPDKTEEAVVWIKKTKEGLITSSKAIEGISFRFDQRHSPDPSRESFGITMYQ